MAFYDWATWAMPPFEQRTISHMAKTYDIREVAPMEITKIVATRLQILTLKCTKFDFELQTPLGELTALPRPPSWI